MAIFDQKCMIVEKKHGKWLSKTMDSLPKLLSLRLNLPISFQNECSGSVKKRLVFLTKLGFRKL